jgi:acylphosphatase
MSSTDLATSEQSDYAFYVTFCGIVHGVGFRRKLCADAKKLGLVGWVRNMQRGSVDSLLQGTQANIGTLLAAVYAGKCNATITNSTMSQVALRNLDDFVVYRKSMHPFSIEDQKRRINFLDLQLSKFSWEITKGNLLSGNHEDLSELFIKLPKRYWPQYIMRNPQIYKPNKASCSFATELWAKGPYQAAIKEYVIAPEILLNDKIKGVDFAKQCRISTPEVYEKYIKLDDIQLKDGVVIKPRNSAGSRGVFLVYKLNKIFEISKKSWLHSERAARDAMKEYLKREKKSDSWIVEEFIQLRDGSAPNDLKFYCFYGRSPLALEVSRTSSGPKYCWWNNDGKLIKTGKYKNKVLQSDPFNKDYFKFVEKLSLKIPSPFMRIDFLRLEDRLVFGEFTPSPGDFEQFDADTDARLGWEFASARGRLVGDFLKGKRFEEFLALVNSEVK